MNEECSTCKFFVNDYYREHDFADGACHKHSPVGHGERGNPGSYHAEGHWPLVGREQWCGDWQQYIPAEPKE